VVLRLSFASSQPREFLDTDENYVDPSHVIEEVFKDDKFFVNFSVS